MPAVNVNIQPEIIRWAVKSDTERKTWRYVNEQYYSVA